jgi:hypothetical protein
VASLRLDGRRARTSADNFAARGRGFLGGGSPSGVKIKATLFVLGAEAQDTLDPTIDDRDGAGSAGQVKFVNLGQTFLPRRLRHIRNAVPARHTNVLIGWQKAR